MTLLAFRQRQRRLLALWVTIVCVSIQQSPVASSSRLSTGVVVGTVLAAAAIARLPAATAAGSNSAEKVVVVEPGSPEYQAYVLYNRANSEADGETKLQLLKQASRL